MRNEFSVEEGIDINKQDVPYQMFCGGPHIEIYGNRKIEYEGKYKILEYSSELLKIKRHKGYITIAGADLSISNVQKYSFCLSGSIDSIIFE